MALLSPFEKIPLQTTANLREDYQVFVSEKWVFAQPLKPASARGLLRLHKDLLRTQVASGSSTSLCAECLWQEGPCAHLLKERHLLQELLTEVCVKLLARIVGKDLTQRISTQPCHNRLKACRVGRPA